MSVLDFIGDVDAMLQWVQRPRTPVMAGAEVLHGHARIASMGPASENAGYGGTEDQGENH